MRKMKLNRIIEQLKWVDFYHDTLDIEDFGADRILMEYGICEEFSDAEIKELEKDLYRLAQKNEFREVLRLTNLESYEEEGVV